MHSIRPRSVSVHVMLLGSTPEVGSEHLQDWHGAPEARLLAATQPTPHCHARLLACSGARGCVAVGTLCTIRSGTTSARQQLQYPHHGHCSSMHSTVSLTLPPTRASILPSCVTTFPCPITRYEWLALLTPDCDVEDSATCCWHMALWGKALQTKWCG